MYIFQEPEIKIDGAYFETPVEGTGLFPGQRSRIHDDMEVGPVGNGHHKGSREIATGNTNIGG